MGRGTVTIYLGKNQNKIQVTCEVASIFLSIFDIIPVCVLLNLLYKINEYFHIIVLMFLLL